MCLGLGHSASDVNMSMKSLDISVLVAGMIKRSNLAVAIVGNKRVRGYSKRRADAEDPLGRAAVRALYADNRRLCA